MFGDTLVRAFESYYGVDGDVVDTIYPYSPAIKIPMAAPTIAWYDGAVDLGIQWLNIESRYVIVLSLLSFKCCYYGNPRKSCFPIFALSLKGDMATPVCSSLFELASVLLCFTGNGMTQINQGLTPGVAISPSCTTVSPCPHWTLSLSGTMPPFSPFPTASLSNRSWFESYMSTPKFCCH